MLRIATWINTISRVAVWIGGVALIFSAVLVTFDVGLRNLFGVTVGGADEIAAYVFGISTTLAFSYTVLQRANIRVDTCTARLSRRARGALDLIGVGLLGAFAGIMSYQGATLVGNSMQLGSRSITPLQIPLAVPQSLWLAGWVLLFVTCAVLMLRGGIAYLRRDMQEVESIVGTRDTESFERIGGGANSTTARAKVDGRSE